MSSDIQLAAKTWNKEFETIEEANRRIHDRVPLDQLDRRADGYAFKVCGLFPIQIPAGAKILEIGSGTGYVMEGVNRYLSAHGVPPGQIDGLDIAEHMLAKARARIGSDKVYNFLHYDGLTIPRPDQSYDLIYSVAALQHVPKPYVYNLFFEMKRLLKPDAYAVVNLLDFRDAPADAWRAEV